MLIREWGDYARYFAQYVQSSERERYKLHSASTKDYITDFGFNTEKNKIVK